MTTQEKDKWLRLSQRYRKLGVTAVNGAFAELENNLWEEGWSPILGQKNKQPSGTGLYQREKNQT